MKTLSDRLRYLLKVNELTEDALAKKVNVSQQAINYVLNGKTRSPKNILEIATALGVNAHWLKTGEGERDADVFAFTSENDDDHTLRVEQRPMACICSKCRLTAWCQPLRKTTSYLSTPT